MVVQYPLQACGARNGCCSNLDRPGRYLFYAGVGATCHCVRIVVDSTEFWFQEPGQSFGAHLLFVMFSDCIVVAGAYSDLFVVGTLVFLQLVSILSSGFPGLGIRWCRSASPV